MLKEFLNCKRCNNRQKGFRIIVEKSAEIYQVIKLPGDLYQLEWWHHQYAIEKIENFKRTRYIEEGWGEIIFRKIGSRYPTKEEITSVNSYVWDLIVKGKLRQNWNNINDREQMRARAKASTVGIVKSFLAD